MYVWRRNVCRRFDVALFLTMMMHGMKKEMKDEVTEYTEKNSARLKSRLYEKHISAEKHGEECGNFLLKLWTKVHCTRIHMYMYEFL
jgi:hypothetical protein